MKTLIAAKTTSSDIHVQLQDRATQCTTNCGYVSIVKVKTKRHVPCSFTFWVFALATTVSALVDEGTVR